MLFFNQGEKHKKHTQKETGVNHFPHFAYILQISHLARIE